MLPQLHYLPRFSVADLQKEIAQLVVVRRVDEEPYYEDDASGNSIIPEDIIIGANQISNDILDYSTNIIGALFTTDHLRYRVLDKALTRDWHGEDTSSIVITDEKFEANQIGWPLYFKVIDFEGIEFPYQRFFQKQSDYEEYKKKIADKTVKNALQVWRSKEEPIQLQAYVHVCHRPTLTNYWHVTIGMYPPENAENPPRANKGWAKTLNSMLLMRLQEYAVIGNEDTYIIPEKVYSVTSA